MKKILIAIIILNSFLSFSQENILVLNKVEENKSDEDRISISFNLKHRLKIDSNKTGDDMSYGVLNE